MNLLETADVCSHPVVLGEMACGVMKNRERILSLLARLTMLPEQNLQTILAFIETKKLWGSGLGWGDAQMLVSCSAERVLLWTRDRALREAASRIGIQQPVLQ